MDFRESKEKKQCRLYACYYSTLLKEVKRENLKKKRNIKLLQKIQRCCDDVQEQIKYNDTGIEGQKYVNQ